MKGLVFTTFYDFIETNFGPDRLDQVIAKSAVPNHGAYTSVGTYPFDEMVALVTAAVQLSGQTMPQLMEQFGEHCFVSWVSYLPAAFQDKDLFDVLASIDDFHETEVRTLYPDAELPSFKVAGRTERHLTLDYHSCKPLADLAVGVIRGASKHMRNPVDISHAPATGPGGAFVRFQISRV